MKHAFFAVLALAAPAAVQARTWVIPHVLERSGTMVAVYTSGLPGTRPARGDGATVSLYLYNSAGQPAVRANGETVCNPCAVTLSKAARQQTIPLPGAGERGVKLGFGVIVVGGSDPDGVSVQVVGENGPGGLSVFGFEPQPIS